MSPHLNTFPKTYFYPADLLIPKTDFARWAVVACDQFTSDPAYWNQVEKIVGNAPSSLRLFLPEIYLSDDNKPALASIRHYMKAYLAEDRLTICPNAMIYVERKLSGGATRRGIVGCIDLEDYDYHENSHAIIRATEETIPERLPPRIAIRENALLELSHILLLADDPQDSIIGRLKECRGELPVLYDFDLMQQGGHITGRLIPEQIQEEINAALQKLADNSPMLFAVGDGNHSLASAKECYQKHPDLFSRYAMVELMNLHDTSLCFEPIYRIVYHIDPDLLFEELTIFFGSTDAENGQPCTVYWGEQSQILHLPPIQKLTVGSLQAFLTYLTASYPEVKVDYVHEADTVRNAARSPRTVGFLYDSIRKEELFPAVLADGSLPRKTFSMGEGCDKRYYLEARKIRITP